MNRRLAALAGTVLFGSAAIAGLYACRPGAPVATAASDLPVPPFPPRIAHGDDYEHCLALLAKDPAGAQALAEAWQARNGDMGASHCLALAQIALGQPATGAAMLEHLAATGPAPNLARAVLYGQAVQARLMIGEPDRAYADASDALAGTPDDTDLLIGRAQASLAMDRLHAATDDLTRALRHEPDRIDALVLRGAAWRRLDRLELAERDMERALTLDPDDTEALLERGLLRQRRGDQAGARADWQRAMQLDPNGSTADLAEQNLALLDMGPRR